MLLITRALVPLPAMWFWAVAAVLEGVGYLLNAVRGIAPDWVSIIVPHALVSIGALVTLHGIVAFRGVPDRSRWIGCAVVAAELVAVAFTTYVVPDRALRVVAVSLATLILMSLCARRLLSGIEPGLRQPARFTSFFFLLMAGFMGWRAMWTVTNPIGDFLDNQLDQVAAMLVYLVTVTGRTFGFVWLTTQAMSIELRRYAHTDPLTGVVNRRAFWQDADREAARARRSGSGLAVVMLDIDRFKRVNDKHHHRGGDAVLQAVASAVTAELRPTDRVARFGGEEFAILLPGADTRAAIRVAQRVRFRIENTAIAFGDDVLHVTASLGVAGSDVTGDVSPIALVRAADDALFLAKDSGRNRVESAADVPPGHSAPTVGDSPQPVPLAD